MKEFVRVGNDCYVRRTEIVAVHDGVPLKDEIRRMAVLPWEDDVRAVIQLRGGQLFPCYVSAKTLMRRLDAAAGGGHRG